MAGTLPLAFASVVLWRYDPLLVVVLVSLIAVTGLVIAPLIRRRQALVDRGRIVEQGSHTELLRMQGTYARLWRHQSGGFLADNTGVSPCDDGNIKINTSSLF